MYNPSDKSALFNRDLAFVETDKAAVAALVQAAVNVELFTIPLYMVSLYSLQGVHQITGKDSDFYKGRYWPGLAPSYKPGSFGNIPENEKAFNTIFSVFIEEMLHLQMASNLATVVGVTPEFTQLSPKAADYAWSCYGDSKTLIPHILDFTDCTKAYNDIKVKLGALDSNQIKLFLAIEEPEGLSKERIRVECRSKYFPEIPLKNWEAGDELPLFGSIGQLYQSLWDYLDITYKEEDGSESTLWEKLYDPAALQRDLFNTVSKSHPYKEYQEFETTVSGWLPEKAKELVFKLICAITDQGEGNGIKKNLRPATGLQYVKPEYQASEKALNVDYPSYTASGEPAPSSHAHARFGNGSHDHYQRFQEIEKDLHTERIVTWDKWRAGYTERWNAQDLKGPDYDTNIYKNLPSAEDVAAALNRLGNPLKKDGTPDKRKRDANYKQFCEIATGAIAGITSVLDDHWKNPSVGFPYPSMGGSGDRLMMCWAVFGELPDLSIGIQRRASNTLYHGCQGMDLNEKNTGVDATCGSPEVYHNCKGSNSCKAEGGCGYVQQVGESQSCGSRVLCGAPSKPSLIYSAPADNVCKGFGGCAVPISASQIYPSLKNSSGAEIQGTMELNDFKGSKHTPQKLSEQIKFEKGDFVYDVAWEAYLKVLASRGAAVDELVKPEPSDIRIAFPPST